ncbi:MAG: branched-chain amino acid ABC transporter permease [Bacillota bacterium]|nr:MAG: branched-chain amino acid ABC transporter permease [Bacillota bacterium]
MQVQTSRWTSRWAMPLLVAAGFALAWAIPRYELINPYYDLILMYIGINIILTVSLNLVNGYMGEFSVGHAGFMAVGAYVASVLTMRVIPWDMAPYLFPLALIGGGIAAGIVALLVAIPSFRTRGDYLALVTLALNMIVKSVIENIDAIGGPRGFLVLLRLTSLPWVYVWVVITLWAIRNFIYSNPGRGVLAIREDEVAAELVGVRTREVKLRAFIISAFFAGVAGGLYAHLLQFIHPRNFDILKSTEILIMVYLGGIGSMMGSILGASIFTVLLEALRFMGVWRMALAPLLLVLLMILRPTGIMGLKEWRGLIPLDERLRLARLAARKGGQARASGN